MLVSWNIHRILEEQFVSTEEEEEETEMGACASKPKVSKENKNAPLTRDVEVEEKKELAEGDVAEKEISGSGAEEKGEVLLKEEEARETEPSTEQIKLEQPVEDETVLVEGKKGEQSAEEAESKTTPAAATTDEELKEAKQEEPEAKAEAKTEVTVVGKEEEEEEEEENKGADVTQKSAVEVETKATETQVQEISKTV
ncbi:cilia- and flagella-associated protein 251-like [Zingiber officinale]|uniref:cilia- and flagella-associated protein 251-like n=1 Tax=Zingiber officinale TaxID=94328 RepID=UPI001C4D80D0|nr:cilia- and flagella-associated protein 251-like [Zingiber officinale]